MKKIIIDTDCGIDDALALIVALKEPSLDILGITTIFGNVTTDQSAINVLRILKLLDREDIPVCLGENLTIDGNVKEPSISVHGKNGIGEVDIPLSSVKPQNVPASEYIVECARKYPGEVEVITLGPLTNIAKALELEPNLPSLIPSLFVMGGAAFVSGNVTACSEANIHADAESARRVFSSGFNLYMIGLDVTTKVQLKKSTLKSLESRQCKESYPVYDFVVRALEYYYNFYMRQEFLIDTCPVHDPLAMLTLIDPSLCSFKLLPMTVIVSDDITNGLTLADRRKRPSEKNMVNVAVDVDECRAIGTLLSYFCKI